MPVEWFVLEPERAVGVAGVLALFLEGAIFTLLQEPTLLPSVLLSKVEPSKSGKVHRLRDYLTLTITLWGKLLAGPILAVIAIASVIASAFVSGDATRTAQLVRWSAWVTATAAILLIFKAQYDAWRDTSAELGKERTKNEAAPHMDINLLNIVPHGKLQEGLTDLFLHIGLVLGEPSEVCIENFSIAIFDSSSSSTFFAAEDVNEWQHVRHEPTDEYSHIPCVPLTKSLTKRGDYVQGWLHFPLPSLPESFVQYRHVMLKVNCTHGTCYTQFQGAHVHPDPYVKGTMRKILDQSRIHGEFPSAGELPEDDRHRL